MRKAIHLSMLLPVIIAFLSACRYSPPSSPEKCSLLVDFNSKRERMFWKGMGAGGFWRIWDGYLLIHNKEKRRRAPWQGLTKTGVIFLRAFNSHHISVQVEGEVLKIIAPPSEDPGVEITLWAGSAQRIRPHSPPYDAGYSLVYTVNRIYLFGGAKKPLSQLEQTAVGISSHSHRLRPHSKFTLRIRQNGNILQGYLNGKLVVDAVDPYYGKRILSNYIGLGAGGVRVKFDNLRVEWEGGNGE